MKKIILIMLAVGIWAGNVVAGVQKPIYLVGIIENNACVLTELNGNKSLSFKSAPVRYDWKEATFCEIIIPKDAFEDKYLFSALTGVGPSAEYIATNKIEANTFMRGGKEYIFSWNEFTMPRFLLFPK